MKKIIKGMRSSTIQSVRFPYTRIIEHKHFEYGTQPKTVITREYPADWKRGDEPYYPINDEKNNAMFAKYQEEAAKMIRSSSVGA